jgi:class 3 adenylate cyclase
MPAIDETYLDAKLAELEQLRAWSPRIISKFEAFIRTDDDWALFRVNAFVFAEERGIPEDDAVELLVLASKVGLFQMSWNLLCPGCGLAVQSLSSLKSLCSVFHCFLCSTDIETRLDDYVQVGFTISPKVRSIAAHRPESLSVEDSFLRFHFTREGRLEAGGMRFVDVIPQAAVGMRHLPAHSKTSFEVEVEAGALSIYDVITQLSFVAVIDDTRSGVNSHLSLRLQDGKLGRAPIELVPGKFSFELANDGEQQSSLVLFAKPRAMLDEMAKVVAAGGSLNLHFDRFLSGRRLLTSHTFRQAFGNEIIKSSEGIGVRDISILFTDLKGSTALYDRIGDLRAFALVNQHFERLGRAVTRYRGAVIKTIGDAVMASFESPVDAVMAARDMLREIESFNDEVGDREIVLKVGVHRGATIAVTLNDRLDFFGQTVNIAARVQGLADADEIYLTEDVYRVPGVQEVLAELHVTPSEATLKGVQKAVSVYRVATSP